MNQALCDVSTMVTEVTIQDYTCPMTKRDDRYLHTPPPTHTHTPWAHIVAKLVDMVVQCSVLVIKLRYEINIKNLIPNLPTPVIATKKLYYLGESSFNFQNFIAFKIFLFACLFVFSM